MLDTHRIAKRFRDAGVPEAQAEAMLETFVEWRAADVAELSTKGDMSALRSDVGSSRMKLEGDIAALETKLGGDIAALEKKLTGDLAALETKLGGDIAALETRIEARLATMTAELRAEIIGAKVDLLKWFIPLFAGQILALTALVVQLVLRNS